MTDVNNDSNATVLVCQCRSLSFEVVKARKNSIDLKCAKCGLPASVKAAGVNSTPVEQRIAERASRSGVVTCGVPSPKKKKPKEGDQGGASGSLSERGMKTFRFLVTAEQAETVHRALEAIRLLNLRDEKFRAQTYQAHAIEYLAADFLGGVPPLILDLMAAAEERIDEEIQAAEERGEPLSAWKVRRMRAASRDELAEEVTKRFDGAVEEDEPADPQEPEDEPDELDVVPLRVGGGEQRDGGSVSAKEVDLSGDGEEVIEVGEDSGDYYDSDEDALESSDNDDGGRLYAAVTAAFRSAAGGFLVSVGETGLEKARSHWDASGGYLLSIIGDPDTATEDGEVPRVYVWMEGDEEIELSEEYAKLVPGGELGVIELVDVPHPDWDAPMVADTREVL